MSKTRSHWEWYDRIVASWSQRSRSPSTTSFLMFLLKVCKVWKGYQICFYWFWDKC